jgi:hypothetical protein
MRLLLLACALLATVFLCAACDPSETHSHGPETKAAAPKIEPPTGVNCTIEFQHLDTVVTISDTKIVKVTDEWIVVGTEEKQSWIPRQRVLLIKIEPK